MGMFLDCAINYFESPTAYGRPQLFDIIKRVRLGDFKEESKVAVPPPNSLVYNLLYNIEEKKETILQIIEQRIRDSPEEVKMSR
jgi:hypothetical protein